MTPDLIPNILNIATAAKRLGISDKQTRRLIADRRIGHVRISEGRLGITEQQILEFISKQTIPAADISEPRAKIRARLV